MGSVVEGVSGFRRVGRGGRDARLHAEGAKVVAVRSLSRRAVCGGAKCEVLAFVWSSVYDAVVFDNDGVLTERTDRGVLREAARAAFESFDVSPEETVLDEFVAGVEPSWVMATCERYGLDVDAFWRERDHQFATHQCRVIDAGEKPTYDDVTALDDLDVPLGVVSNNQNATIDHLFEVHDLHEHFETWYGREPTMESVRLKKPGPYYIERALEDLGVSSALYVGDKESDVTAAVAAGIDVALIRRPHNQALDPSPAPTYELESLHAIPPLLDRY